MRYRPEIDGLRAISVLAIVLFHAGITQLSGGFVGVDVFFVISGYLITSIILREKAAGHFSFASFYERRARRILPLLLFVCLCTVPFSWMLLLPGDMKIYAASLAGAATFTINFMAANNVGYFDPSAEFQPLLHIWSLAVEEQYYLLFPVLMVILWRFGRAAVLGAILLLIAAGIVIAEIWLPSSADASFYLLPSRGWTILLGAVAAFVFEHNQVAPVISGPSQGASAIGLALILAGIFIFDATTPFPGVLTLVPTMGAMLVILFAGPGTIVHAMLAWAPLRWIGLISYGAYLWHNPLFAFARYGRQSEPSAITMAAATVATFALAWATFLLIEKPFRNRSRFTRRSVVTTVTTGSLVLILLAALGITQDGFGDRFAPHTQQILAAAEHRNPSRAVCTSNGPRIIAPENSCILGDSENVTWALLGDSHADALSVPLSGALSSKGIGMRELTYAACPPAIGLHNIALRSNLCADYMAQAFDYLAESPAIEGVLVHARFTLYLEGDRFDNGEGGREPNEFAGFDKVGNHSAAGLSEDRKVRVAAAYRESAQALLDMGKTVVLVTSVPEAGWDVPRKMAFDYIRTGSPANLSTSYQNFIDRNDATLQALTTLPSHPRLHVVRADRVFCDTPEQPGRCMVSKDNVPLYADTDHLTNRGADLLIDALADLLE